MRIPKGEVMFKASQVILIYNQGSQSISLDYFSTVALHENYLGTDKNIDMEPHPRLIESKYLRLGHRHYF